MNADEEKRREERKREMEESMEEIGNSILSGLSSVTKISASVLENVVENIDNDHSKNADRIKANLAKKRRKDIEKRIKKAEKKRKNEIDKIGWFVFFVALLVFDWDFFVCVFLAIGIEFLLDKFYKPKVELPKISNEEITYTEEFLQIIEKSSGKLNDIEACMTKAKDAEIREHSANLFNRGMDIMEYIQENPEKISKAGRFLSYYLDTASKICDKYLDFEKGNIDSREIEDVINSTKRAMILLEKAFDNEFVKLMEDDIADIEAEVKVLENSMKWDNYID